MSASVYTAVVGASNGVTYTSGETFSGSLSAASDIVTYTLGSALQSLQTSMTLTATLASQRTEAAINALVTLSTTSSGIRIAETSGVAAILSRSYLPIVSPSSSFTTNSSSITQTANSSSTAYVTNASINSTAATQSAVTSSPSATVSSSSASSSGSSTSSKGHSTGELIGVAIGVLIAGALIAGLITYAVMKKRSKKNLKRRYNSVQRQPSPNPMAGEAVIVAGKSWQRHLPQSESDHTISRSTTELFDQIELHVENFYTNRMVEMQSTVVDQPSQLLSDAMSSGLRPTAAIKYVMTSIVLSSINFQGDSEYSLLPANFNALKVQADYKQPGFDQAISQWRTLTAYLGANTLQTETYLSERDRKMTAITRQLCRTFQPWLQGDNNSCHQSTNGILRRGSDLGVMLFSQPASFVWDWGKDQQRRGERATILPSLLKVTDETAQPLSKHVCLVKRRTDT